MTPPLIALEEHFFSTEMFEHLGDKYAGQFLALPGLHDKLKDLDQLRLDEMEKGKVSLQVISHAPAPGALTPEQSTRANNQLAEAVKKHSKRFAGFAVLPMGNPEAAAKELERCMKELNFVGALIDNHILGKYYDGPEYHPFWQKAQDLDAPIYIHPTWPSDTMVENQYSGNFTDGAARSLGASGWGWHTETGLHTLRLYASGLFDKFPKLKVVIGHMGEMIPYHFERICKLSLRWGDWERKFEQVWRENIWVTTSGVWSLSPLKVMLDNTPIEHILFSVDYPFARNEEGLEWIEKLEGSGLVSKEQLEMISFRNSEKLLGVKAPR